MQGGACPPPDPHRPRGGMRRPPLLGVAAKAFRKRIDTPLAAFALLALQAAAGDWP